jgi:hypothetical protein
LDGAKVQNYAITLVAGNLEIIPATLTVILDSGSLVQSYTGSARSVSWSTQPSGVATRVTYDGATTQPIVAGSYTVVVQSDDANYSGKTSGVLVIRSTVESIRVESYLVGAGLMPVGDSNGRYFLQASLGQGIAGAVPVVSGIQVESGFWMTGRLTEALNPLLVQVPSAEVAAKGIVVLSSSTSNAESGRVLRAQDPQIASGIRLPEARLSVVPLPESLRIRIQVSGIAGARWKVQSLDGLHAEGWRDQGVLELSPEGSGFIETEVVSESVMRFYRLVQP